MYDVFKLQKVFYMRRHLEITARQVLLMSRAAHSVTSLALLVTTEKLLALKSNFDSINQDSPSRSFLASA